MQLRSAHTASVLASRVLAYWALAFLILAGSAFARPPARFGLAPSSKDLATLEGVSDSAYRTVFRVTSDVDLAGAAKSITFSNRDAQGRQNASACVLSYDSLGQALRLDAGTDLSLKAPAQVTVVENPFWRSSFARSPEIFLYQMTLVSRAGMEFGLSCQNYDAGNAFGKIVDPEPSRWRVGHMAHIGSNPATGFQIWMDVNPAVVR